MNSSHSQAKLQRRVADAYGPEAASTVGAALAVLDPTQPGDEARARAVESATRLCELQIHPSTVVAALVFDSLAAGRIDATAIGEIDPEAAGLCEGVRRLGAIAWDRLEEEAAENLRKMFLAMASDVRVVLLALVLRVQKMRDLDQLPDAQAQRIAEETLEIYAALANRLGVWQLKWELEDLAFRRLQPQTYDEIKRLLADKRAERTAAIERVTVMLQQRLAEAGITADVQGRPKHIYSIYKKMQRKGVGFFEIYDVSAVRIIVPALADCYAALGLVHGEWTPIASEFDDYIAKPKENYYRSLHTAVIGPDGRPLEIQIRTREMHDYNEMGIAAHWRYKEAKRGDRRFDEKVTWLRQLMEWQKDVTDPHDVAQSLRTDIFSDQVYVFTPEGDVIDLPVDSTPIDFAYRVHTQVGHRCRGARVGGQIVPLDHRLRTGDRVEILTTKSGAPSRDWLSPHLGYVATSGARQKIRQFFRLQKRDESVQSGRELVERELKKLGLAPTKLEATAALYVQYPNVEDFLAAVGYGDVSVQSVAGRLLEAERRTDSRVPAAALTRTSAPPPARRAAASVSVAGVDDVLSHPARCCNPVPGDDVLGFITRGRGVAIHRRDCPNVRLHHEPERWMPLSWGGGRDGPTYPVDVQVLAYDRKGLLRDIVEVVATEGINLLSTSARSNERAETAVVDVTLKIRDSDQLVRVLAKLERLTDVQSARRVAG